MERVKIEIAVGMFVFAGLMCVGYLTIKLGKMELIGNKGYQQIYARFATVAGLKSGAMVEMAGVPIGRVEEITLEKQDQVARVRMKIDSAVELNEDVSAAVRTRGLIGDKYVNIEPGGAEIVLKDGDTIKKTHSAIEIEDLLGKYAFGDIK